MSISNYKYLGISYHIPEHPSINYDAIKRSLVHVYQNIPLETTNFQTEVNYYINRKQSFSGNVVLINKIKDEQITYNLGKPAMKISIVTDYVPWRLHLEEGTLTIQQALFILDGACRGFRELLHRVRFPFIIQNHMIGVDFQGEVKVWWNDMFYKSNFGFIMTPTVKLRDMVRSLLQAVYSRMNQSDSLQLERQLANAEGCFMALEDKICKASCGLNLKYLGKKLISNKEQYITAMRQSGLSMSKNNSIMVEPLKMSSVSKFGYLSSEKIILSPKKELKYSPKIITKRTYQGTFPNFEDKINIIKGDIQNLRSVAQDSQTPLNSISQARILRSSRSVENIFSFKRSLSGNIEMPEGGQIMKESSVIGPNEDLTISRFVEPVFHSMPIIKTQSMTSIQPNDHCGVCNNVQQLRRSQISQTASNDPMFLSKLQNLASQDKSIISTSRSMNESRLQKKPSIQTSKNKFGESEKKLPQSRYFTTLFQA